MIKFSTLMAMHCVLGLLATPTFANDFFPTCTFHPGEGRIYAQRAAGTDTFYHDLVRIDPRTATGDVVGILTDLSQFGSFTYHAPRQGFVADQGAGPLLLVDPQDASVTVLCERGDFGAVTSLGSVLLGIGTWFHPGGVVDLENCAITSPFFDDAAHSLVNMVYNPTADVLFGYSIDGGTIGQIDPHDGSLRHVATLATSLWGEPVCFAWDDASQELYAIQGAGRLITIDPETGQWSFVGDIQVGAGNTSEPVPEMPDDPDNDDTIAGGGPRMCGAAGMVAFLLTAVPLLASKWRRLTQERVRLVEIQPPP